MAILPVRTCLALAAAITAGAVEVDVCDLRFGLGFGPMPNEKDGSIVWGPSGALDVPTTESYSPAPGASFALTGAFGHLAPIGFIWGAEVRYVSGTQEIEAINDGGVITTPTGGKLNFRYTSTGVAGNAGLGIALSPTWHAELVGIAGLDRVESDSPANTNTPNAIESQPGSGNGHTLGIRLGVFWTDESRWQFGLTGEWTKTVSSVENSYADLTTRFDHLTAVGFGARASLGYRF